MCSIRKDIYPKRSDVSPREWELIVEQHTARTKAERRLFECTKPLPQKCRIDYDPERMLVFKCLFAPKLPLLGDPNEHTKDDIARCNALRPARRIQVQLLKNARDVSGPWARRPSGQTLTSYEHRDRGYDARVVRKSGKS